MKKKLLLVFAAGFFTISAFGQGVIVINPVPVTNGLTGTLADSSIVAALYYGPAGGPEDSMQLLTPAAALVNGQAQFGAQTIIPALPPGVSTMFDVRAWSSGYPSYESAIASGLPSVLVGKSILLTAALGGSPTPPPIPGSLSFPGFSVYPVPEASARALVVVGFGVCALSRRRFRLNVVATRS